MKTQITNKHKLIIYMCVILICMTVIGVQEFSVNTEANPEYYTQATIQNESKFDVIIRLHCYIKNENQEYELTSTKTIEKTNKIIELPEGVTKVDCSVLINKKVVAKHVFNVEKDPEVYVNILTARFMNISMETIVFSRD